MRSGQGVWISTGFHEDAVLQFAQQYGITDVAIQSYDTSGIPNNGGKWEKHDLVKLRLKVENHGMKLTALENVMVPAELRGDRDIRRKATEWLERVGLADRAHHYPSQLSGGEQQRVAVARAFVTSPSVLFADEPTGNLDESNAAHVTELLFSLNRDQGTTLILITHNLALAGQASRVLEMKGGRMIHESTSGVR